MTARLIHAGRRMALLMGVLALAACTTELKPLTIGELDQIAADREARIVDASQEPITGPIDLYEAMARAIKYNLDHRVELKEEALRMAEFQLSEYELLPDLIANAEYTGRSNDPGASSISLLTGTPSLEPSRSTERNVLEADLTLSWDILDFGISYVRSKQEADEVLIALEQRRSAINRVIEDVRTAYWRAVSAQRLLGRLEELQGEVMQALARSEALSQRSIVEPLGALTYQRELLTVIRAVQELRRDLAIAKNQLAALMNLPQGEPYELMMPDREAPLPVVEMNAAELTKLSFRNRPELREISYRLRINEREDDIAILEALPSLRAFLSGNVSTNELLFNQNFIGWGARASWNLINLVRLPQRRDTVSSGGELLDARALALTQAIATQVWVSKARFDSLSEELTIAGKVQRVNGEIARQVGIEAQVGAVGTQDFVREELNAILAELRYDVTYADLQNAYANLYASVGLDAYAPGLSGSEPVGEMAAALRLLWAERGDTGGTLTN